MATSKGLLKGISDRMQLGLENTRNDKVLVT